ncbi:MAG: hypothetical protein IIW54_13365 [Lachnospiraceae bacterium]|nr:hypothetical protein [Lachnospiraceae bacterium]
MENYKMKEIFADEAFVKSLMELESAAEVQEALKEKGIELTEDDIMALRDIILKVEEGELSREQLESWAAQAEDGELPEEMLELVSGGLLISSLLIGIAITTAATGVAVGTTVGIGAGVVSAIKNRW